MKHKILSLILAAAMLLNIGATPVFAADSSALPAQEGGTTIDASGDVDPACTCEAAEGEVHAEDCPQYIVPDEPEQPVDPSETAEPEQPVDPSETAEPEQPVDSSDSAEPEQSVEPVCTCETKCAGDAIDTECPVCTAEDDSCDACGYTLYDVWVGGVQVSGIPDANGNIDVTSLVNDENKVSGTVTFTLARAAEDNPDTSALENAPTLTLSGAGITAAATPVDVDYDYNPLRGIYSRSALNLVLTGANTITADTVADSAGVMADAENLTINGDGSLKINGCGHGIRANSLVTDGVTVEIIDSVYAITLNVGGTITGSTVSAVGSNQGISTINGMIKIDNSSVYAKGENNSFYGTSSDGVSVALVDGAHVKAEGEIDADIGVNSDGSGYLRGTDGGTFEHKVAGNLEHSGTYFEYLGEGHYKFSPVAGSEGHAIVCADEGCSLNMTGSVAPHSWNANADGGEVCTICSYTCYEVWVGSVQVAGVPDENGEITVTGDSITGTVTYAPATKTLTLNGASITGESLEDTIYSASALNLMLTGENKIIGDYGIMANDARMTIGGGGSLTLAVRDYGLSAYSLMIDGVTLNIDSETVYTGAIVLDAGGTIKDSTVKAVGTSSKYQQATICTDRGTFEIENSSVCVESGYIGIYGKTADVSVSLNGNVHVKVDGKIMAGGGVESDGSGYLRGERGDMFEHKEAGALKSDTYFEYVGADHYEVSATAISEAHTIDCVDENCILQLTNANAPHRWNPTADGATCADCPASAAASVTESGTTVYYYDFENALDAAEDNANAVLKLFADVETIRVSTGGFTLDPNGKSITKLSFGDDSQPISIAARPANIPAVSAVDYGVFAKPYGGVALEAEWFTSDMTGYVVVKDGDNLKLTEGITEAMVTLSSDSITYSGRQQTPTVTVKWTDGLGGHIDLKEGQHYAVIYKDSKGDQASPINADTYTVTITGMGGYAGKVEKTYTIEPKSLANATVAAPNQTYTDSKLTPEIAVTLAGYDVKADDYDVSYSPDTLTDAGRYTITVTGKGNFTGEATGTFTIDQAAALTFSGEMSVANKLEHSYTFDLSAIVPGNHGAWGSDPAVEYVLGVNITTDGYYDKNNQPASISGHVLTLPIQEVDSITEGSIGTVTVTIKSQNYKDSTLTITVNSANKETVEITGVTAKDGIYNGSAQQGYTGTPTSAFGATGYEITYTGRGSTSYDSATAPTGAGDYTVTYKVPDSNPDYMGAKSLDFSIAPKPLSWNTSSVTVSQAYVPDKVGVEDTPPISSVTLSGVISGDDVNWTGTVQSAEFADDDIGENKTVTVTLTGLILTGTDAANYTAPATTFTITGRITDPENTNGDETLGTLEGGLIVSGDELPTDDEMNEVYGTTAAEALRAKFGDTNVMESIQTALKEAAAKTAGTNSSGMNHKVLEIFLEYYDNTAQKWIRITEDNLDNVKSKIPGGVPVTIPFDLLGSDINSSNYSSYDFLLHHMITLPLDNANVGDIEQLTVTVDASGLHATVENGFSPFVISYAKKPTGSSGGSSSGSSGDSSSSDSSSGGSTSTYKDGECDFWIGVKAQIEVVKSGTTLRVSARDYTRMPIEVMNALRARSNVTLNITWNGGNDISIPSALAPTPESHRVYYELSELATVFPAKAAAVPVQAADTDTEEESPASTSPAMGNTDGETSEPEGEKIATEEETSEGAAPETEEMIQEETGKEETKEGCIWHWLMLLFMLACVLFIVIGKRKPLKTALIALGVDAALTVIVMIVGSCSLDIPFALGTLLVAGASIPVKNVSRNCE